jgi:hypothetical protein
MRLEVDLVEVTADEEQVELIQMAESDLMAAARARAVEYRLGEFGVTSHLADTADA